VLHSPGRLFQVFDLGSKDPRTGLFKWQLVSTEVLEGSADKPGMQIQPSQQSSVRVGEVRANTVQGPPAGRGDTQQVDTQPLRDSADIVGGPKEGQSPSERLDSFANKVNERLSNLAEKTGMDLSQVQDDFSGYVQRLQDGISDGSLSGADLERGVRNALAMTAGTVRSAMAPGQAAGSQALGKPGEAGKPAAVGNTGSVEGGSSPSERLDGFEAQVNERIGALAEGADQETVAALREVQQSFAEKLGALRDGLADGSLDATAVGQGVQSALSNLGQGIKAAVAPKTDSESTNSDNFGTGSTDGGATLANVASADSAGAVKQAPGGNAAAEADDVDGAGSDAEGDVAGRLDAFASTLADRLDGFKQDGVGGEALQNAGADLLGLLDRLSSAVEGGGITGDHAGSLFQRALAGLSSDMGDMVGKLDNQMNLYGRDAQRADSAS
jgi:hypothetical protein